MARKGNMTSRMKEREEEETKYRKGDEKKGQETKGHKGI